MKLFYLFLILIVSGFILGYVTFYFTQGQMLVINGVSFLIPGDGSRFRVISPGHEAVTVYVAGSSYSRKRIQIKDGAGILISGDSNEMLKY